MLAHSVFRFLLPVSIVVLLRFLCAVILYSILTPADAIHSTLHNELYIFVAWDSEHYDSIARFWYPRTLSGLWEFFPLYPALIRILVLFGLGVSAGALLVATASGLVSIVVFQKIADHYLPHDRALVATLVYFLLPPVFVFMAVNYSEPVFLLFSLLAWYCHINEEAWKSSIAATLSTLVRPIGVFMIIPIGCQYLWRRQYRKLVYCTVPVFTLVGWMIYSFLMTGTFAVFYARETYWRSEYYARVQETIRESLQGHMDVAASKLLEYAHAHVIVLVASLASLAIVGVLAFRIIKLDKALGLYTIVSIGGVLYFGLPTSFVSFPRYLAFIFPIGLALSTRKMNFAYLSVIILALLDCLAWYAFLADSFY